jgi:hypothetical protein
VASLHAFDPLELSLQRILETTVAIAPASLALLNLETFEDQGNPRRVFLQIATDPEAAEAASTVSTILAGLTADAATRALQDAGPFDQGYLVPLCLHRDLGYGWIYLHAAAPDQVALQALPLLAAHASNALYATVAQSMLAAREGALFESITV